MVAVRPMGVGAKPAATSVAVPFIRTNVITPGMAARVVTELTL